MRLLALFFILTLNMGVATAAIKRPQAKLASPTQSAKSLLLASQGNTGLTIQISRDPMPDAKHPIYISNESPEKGFLVRLFDDPNSFLIMLFTIVLGLAALWQGRILSRQDERLIESLDAAKAANDLAKDSAERQLRAYLSAEPGNPDNVSGRFAYSIKDQVYNEFAFRQCHIATRINLFNRGQTPAYKVSFRVTFIFYDPTKDVFTPDDILKIVETLPDETKRYAGTINAGAHFTAEYYVSKDIRFDDCRGFSTTSAVRMEGIEREFDWSMSDIEEFKAKRLMVIFGASYVDAFDNKRIAVITETCPSNSINEFGFYPEGMISS